MSSAILYLAIVAIWACVLIPRWLRRDSARGATAPAEPPVAPAGTAEADELADSAAEDDDSAVDDEPEPAQPALSEDDSRHRMLLARRRLLLMLLGLEATAIALAFLGLAAIWVVAPPTVMLGGYLLLLREASRADAEQARAEAEAATQARERARARRARTASPTSPAPSPSSKDTPAEGTSTAGVPAAAAALAAKFAAAPVPADHEDPGPGRDFAPGLAGKYTPSSAEAEAEAAEDDYYDGYQPPRLRAVGD